MTPIRAIALAAVSALVIAYVTGPAGSAASAACGPMIEIKDPGLRASFDRFEATQSATAAKACAAYRNVAL